MADAETTRPRPALARLILALRSPGRDRPGGAGRRSRQTPRDLFTPDLFKERAFEDLGPAHRLRPDHQPALHRRPDDPGPEDRAARPRARDRHRLAATRPPILSKLARLVYTVERYRT